MVLYFREKDYKPMILNRTNAKSIQALVGSPYVEDWAGHRITLYATTTRLGGEMVECLRIRPTVSDESAPIHCEECGSVLTAVGKMNAYQFSLNTMAKFGKILCMDCAMKAKAELDKAEQKKAEKDGGK